MEGFHSPHFAAHPPRCAKPSIGKLVWARLQNHGAAVCVHVSEWRRPPEDAKRVFISGGVLSGHRGERLVASVPRAAWNDRLGSRQEQQCRLSAWGGGQLESTHKQQQRSAVRANGPCSITGRSAIHEQNSSTGSTAPTGTSDAARAHASWVMASDVGTGCNSCLTSGLHTSARNRASMEAPWSRLQAVRQPRVPWTTEAVR